MSPQSPDQPGVASLAVRYLILHATRLYMILRQPARKAYRLLPGETPNIKNSFLLILRHFLDWFPLTLLSLRAKPIQEPRHSGLAIHLRHNTISDTPMHSHYIYAYLARYRIDLISSNVYLDYPMCPRRSQFGHLPNQERFLGIL